MLYIATPEVDTICSQCRAAELEPYDSRLPEGELWRRIHASAEFIRVITTEVPAFTKSDPTQASPLAQIAAELKGFCAGDPLCVTRDFHCLEPAYQCVWLLKTPDVRLFGWFIRKDWMVLHTAADKNVIGDIKQNYQPFIDSSTVFRQSISQFLPSPLIGVRASDVVSNRVK